MWLAFFNYYGNMEFIINIEMIMVKFEGKYLNRKKNGKGKNIL